MSSRLMLALAQPGANNNRRSTSTWLRSINDISLKMVHIQRGIRGFESLSQPVSDMVRASRLRFFGHVARAHPTEVHRHAVQAAMQKPPSSWKRPQGRPSSTWLRVVADDVHQMNFGIHTAWRKTADREKWCHVVGTATLQPE